MKAPIRPAGTFSPDSGEKGHDFVCPLLLLRSEHVGWLAEDGFGGFHECFGERRMIAFPDVPWYVARMS